MSSKPKQTETAKTPEPKKPVELEKEDLQKVDGAVFADGSVRFIRDNIGTTTLR